MKTHLPILLFGCLSASITMCSSLSASPTVNNQQKVLNQTNKNQTQRIYLSGTGLNDTKNWAFHCSEGSNSGRWDSIPVPSQWELHGYGDYTYGSWYTISTDTTQSRKKVHSTTRFKVTPTWNTKMIGVAFQ